MFKLIVKGAEVECRMEAEKRHITIASVSTRKTGECILSTNDSEKRIMEWFNSGKIHAPFPVGTLLHYWEEK